MSEPYRVAIYASPGSHPHNNQADKTLAGNSSAQTTLGEDMSAQKTLADDMPPQKTLGGNTSADNTPARTDPTTGRSYLSDPVGDELAERAEAWLGRASNGRHLNTESPAGWTRAQLDHITHEPRRYGFHGTLKAPFRLADGCTLNDFNQAVAEFAAKYEAVAIPYLTLKRIGSFYALVPGDEANITPLTTLAQEIVTKLDMWRAPLSEQELSRRHPETLSPRKLQLLKQWGYPYVLEEFRFHLTLTGNVPDEHREAVEVALNKWFATSLGQNLHLNSLAVFVEPEPGAAFELHSAHPLNSKPTIETAPADEAVLASPTSEREETT